MVRWMCEHRVALHDAVGEFNALHDLRLRLASHRLASAQRERCDKGWTRHGSP